MNDARPKVALIGAGNWGKKLLKEINIHAEVVWVVHNGSPETTEFISANYPNIKHTQEIVHVLNDASITAVFVATPINTLYDIGNKVLDAHKHLFIEKPGSSNPDELEKLVKKSNDLKLILAVGYEFIHHPALKKIKEAINVSDIESIHMEWHKWGSFSESSVINLLPHEISIMLLLVGDNLTILDMNIAKVVSDSDILNTKIKSGDIEITSLINRVSPNKYKSVTISTADKSILWYDNDLFEISKSKGELVPINIENSSTISNEINDFLQSIKNNTLPISNGLLSIKIFKLIQNKI